MAQKTVLRATDKEDVMNKENNALERRHFLSLIGKSALGLWLLQLIPSVPGAITKRPARKKSPSNPLAARVKAHPQAVERKTRLT